MGSAGEPLEPTVADALRTVEMSLRKPTGAEVMYEADPIRLVDQLLARYRSEEYVCSCRPGGQRGKEA
jgi:hypothetical protein